MAELANDAAGAAHSTHTVITTKATIPPYGLQPTLSTSNPRVYLRPFRELDQQALFELRSQIEVMSFSAKGTVDANLDETKAWMLRYLHRSPEAAPSTSATVLTQEKARAFSFVIVWHGGDGTNVDVDESVTDRVVGVIGIGSIEPEPELGYMIRKEFWGQGIATVAMTAFLDAWWKLPRTSTRTVVQSHRGKEGHYHDHASSHHGQPAQETVVTEKLLAVVATHNTGSVRLMQKYGFQHESQETLFERGENVTLATYILLRPSSTASHTE